MSPSKMAHDEGGFTMVEIIVAAALILTIVLGLLAAFDAMTRMAHAAQRHQQALAYGQREIERLRTLDYGSQLGLTSLPVASASDGNPASAPSNNPADPNFYVSGSSLKIMTSYSDKTSGLQAGVNPNPEPLVATGPGEPTLTSPQVVTGPQSFDADGLRGKIYRYVTYVAQHCPPITVSNITNPCLNLAGVNIAKTKRITLALVLDRVASGAGPAKPIWISTVVADPLATPAGIAPPNISTGVSVTAQPLYLYDTRCTASTRQPITASHSSRDTRSLGCGGGLTAPNPPDLMDKDVTPGAASDPFYNYSNEVSRPTPNGLSAPAGLALVRPAAATCAIGPTALESASRIHSWASPPVATTGFSIPAGGRAGLSLWTHTRDGSAGAVKMCAVLSSMVAGVSTPIGSGNYEPAQWPGTPTQLSFAWDLPLSVTTLVSGARLSLTLWITSSSSKDVVLLYDHPSYQSSLTVTTTTPLS